MELATSARQRLVERLLGHDPKQRLRLTQALHSLAMFVAYALVQHGEVMLGLMDLEASNRLTTFTLGGSLLFCLLIRSGLNLRLAPAEPSLALWLVLHALISLVWSYAITGPARGVLLAIMLMALLFAGMFGLQPRQSKRLALLAFVMLTGVMIWRTQFAEQRYDTRLEIIHMLFAAVTLAANASLASGFGRMRQRLFAQKKELAQALDLNRQLATRDALTGLLNRRAMVELITQPRPRAGQGGDRSSLALLDLDFFKRINDGHGHNAGDAVLQRFAEVLTAGVRAGDVVSRWGGEEFLLLMTDTAMAEAVVVIQRLHDDVRSASFDAAAPGLRVSFSAGLTEIAEAERYEEAVERADRALYRAKERGRDRTEHFAEG